jgi:lactoylglutathione lyase
MKLGYITIYVPNVEQALAFYEKAFNLKQCFLHESKQYAELDTGASKLSFASEELAGSNKFPFIRNRLSNDAPAGIEIAFVTDDVANAYQKAIHAGAVSVKGPTEKPWGQVVSYVRDLNGVLIEICSPVIITDTPS